MKKILLVAVVAVFGAGLQAKWFGTNKAEEVRSYLKEVEGKTFQQPKDMIQAWINFKQKKFRMSAQELKDCLAKVPDDQKPALQTVIDDYEKLANDLGAIKIPDAGYPHEMKHVREWLSLHAEKMQLVAKQLAIVAEQLKSKTAKKMSEVKAKIASQINKALEAKEELKAKAIQIATVKAPVKATAAAEEVKTMQ